MYGSKSKWKTSFIEPSTTLVVTKLKLLHHKNKDPEEDWLRFVVTSRAKSKIKSALKEDKKVIAVVGKEIAESEN